MININWDNKPTWYGLMALLLALAWPGLVLAGYRQLAASTRLHPRSTPLLPIFR